MASSEDKTAMGCLVMTAMGVTFWMSVVALVVAIVK